MIQSVTERLQSALEQRSDDARAPSGVVSAAIDAVKAVISDSQDTHQPALPKLHDSLGNVLLKPLSELEASKLAATARVSQGLLLGGHPARAARALTQVHSSVQFQHADDANMKQLRALHPVAHSADHEKQLPQIPADTADIAVDHSAALRKLVRSMADGKAAGPSGWTGDMLKPLTGSDMCMRGIAALCSDIINNKLNDASKHMLLACRLVAIRKPDGVSVRPIAVGAVFYRLAALRQVNLVLEAARALLLPHQLGIGVSGGCEAAVHIVRNALQNESSALAALLVDFENAFNTISRHKILAALYSQPSLQALFKVTAFAYSSPSALLVKVGDKLSAQLHSSQGVRQGDPLSSLLFALAIAPVYAAALRDIPDAACTAIIDDGSFIAPPAVLPRVYEQLVKEAAEHGLTVQTRKTQLVYLHNDKADPTLKLQDSTLDLFERAQIRVQHDHVKLLGAIVGRTHEIESAQTLRHVQQHDIFYHTLLAQLMPIQESMTLLRLSGIPRLNYLQRTTPPASLQRAAEHLDACNSAAFRVPLQLTDVPLELEAEVSLQCSMPLNKGGLGMHSAVTTMHASFVSSIARSKELVANLSDQTLTAYAALSRLTEQQLDVSLTVLHQTQHAPSDMALPRNCAEWHSDERFAARPRGADLNQFATADWHSKLSRARVEHDYKARTAPVQVADKNAPTAAEQAAQVGVARWNAVSAPGAKEWLQVIATEFDLRLNMELFRMSVRVRLGLPPTAQQRVQCALCRKPHASAECHHLACASLSRHATNKHHTVVNALASGARRAAAVANAEPRGLNESDGLRPDLQLLLDARSILSDIVISHPTAPSHVARAQQQLAVAEHAATLKTRKYAALALKQRAAFIPFSMETYGGMSKHARELIDVIVQYAVDHQVLFSKQEIRTRLVGIIAIAVQRGNALAILAGYRKAARSRS